MNVLVTGAAGFIGSAIVERLLAEGHAVTACARSAKNLPASERLHYRRTDLGRMLADDDWLPLLDQVDAVVNAAGILREDRRGDFNRIHCQMPQALARACAARGIRRYVQISALGHPEDGEFIASKHRLDQSLLAMQDLQALVIRPSVVVSLRGSYGGTSMLRAMAALPGVLLLPGDGSQKIQPLWLEDLAEMVVSGLSLAKPEPLVIDAVGPEVVTLRDFLLATRRWLKIPAPWRVIRTPMPLVRLANTLGDWVRAGPLGRTMGQMLARGNVSNGNAATSFVGLGVQPRSVIAGLDQSASFVQDRWQARLYPLVPMAWLALIVIWLVSAISGFLADPADYGPVLDRMGVAESYQAGLVLATSVLNLVLAVALALRRWLPMVLTLMLLSVIGYTLGLGMLAPEQWLELTGGLVKNLGLIVLILVVMVLENRR